MNLLTIPTKNKQTGIKIKCLKCKYQLSDTCKLTNKKLSQCEHKDKHRFNLVVHVPNTKTSRKTKIIEAKDYSSATIELMNFKKELEQSSYQTIMIKGNAPQKTTLIAFAADYLDMLSGVNTPKHLIRIRSKDYIVETKRVIERFCICLKKKGYNLEVLDLKKVGDNEVEIFHEYLLDELKLGQNYYNKHFVIMKTFINWVIDVKDYKIKNPFSNSELSFIKKEQTIISKDEFNKLIEVTTEENGWGYHSGEKRNLFKKWLPYAFRLGLETGVRAEELVSLKWSDLIEIEKGVFVFRISNLKVNRIKEGKDTGSYVRHIPLTKGLNNLLLEMGLEHKKNSDDFILDRENKVSEKYMMSSISRGFTHFIKLATKKQIQFKDLRKTYITMLTMKVGDKAKLFSGHSNDEVLKNHYLSSAHLAGNLNNFEIF